jgi:protein required for attachment to host cells
MRLPTKKNVKWIVVANGREGRILVVKGHQLIEEKKVTLNNNKARLQSHDIGNERPGRVQESANSARHAIEPRLDLHEKVKLEFAETFAKVLNEGFIKSSFDDLIVAASPEFLGEIRSSLGKNVLEKISKEINKDFTHMQDDEVLRALGVRVVEMA